ncbi:MAG: phosphoenolpyruvate--protein phosphotransferase [Synergistaceae bacterium]|jgi:phosphotransferase system enzyme I (PtsI)|uniref:phosphoenolpyruvate--protein phosphotransferase n=1 Tax=Aminivibrio sp. TaxID=1872489 RepID=UPI0016A3A71E|nr:phosphoenolpyruvate--protein phosphotransferase [Synergistaceae bacterium]MDD3689841.1 phosphoenolpyruvate--protein phosphotransferase [Synergistaceae bacterium]MDD4021349.1 phosphoenolpyruvate--protein phosphotransferase [Synergistaceae bacterium]MDD4613282.1 phosphoenolpyruvate--protein phosphotransferase [Synergistaceae bacterium]NLO58798.1 phosphoenolpyruvate--protein phosphotransferase [Synergistaceae bacterium]
MKGIGASPGIAVGRVVIHWKEQIDILREFVEEPEREIGRFRTAMEFAGEQIRETYSRVLETVGPGEAAIFKSHGLMLRDPDFVGQIERMILDESINAEWAVKTVADNLIQIFESMGNDYMKARSDDVKDISDRVLKLLLQVGGVDLSNLGEKSVVVAREITPSDISQLDRDNTLGIISETGGKSSHSAILARTLEIPAVMGVRDILDYVENGDLIIVDGETGLVFINPDEETVARYEDLLAKYECFKKSLSDIRGMSTVTLDGVEIELAANVASPKDLDDVFKNDGEAIGLYRTEFLYLDSSLLPPEDLQFEDYKNVVEAMEGRPVIIRTLDIGGDKKLDYLAIPEEENPFLGYRAIRLCLDRQEIFKVQLRAILRASAFGCVRILFPMISSLEELREAKKILEETKEELRTEGIPFDESVQSGIMVEVPSAAILSDYFAKEVDFFSIGTNDLIQYTVAVDRGNEKLSHLYSQYHPAVLRLIKTVIDNGREAGIWVGMCGESAGDPKLIPVLLGMGLKEFSMTASSILQARWIIRNLRKSDLEQAAEKVLSLPTAEDVEHYCTALLQSLNLCR